MRQTFVKSLMEAGFRGDRAEFDRIFDAGLPVVYALTLQRAAGDHVCAQLLVTELLVRALRQSEPPAPPYDDAAEQPAQQTTRGAA